MARKKKEPTKSKTAGNSALARARAAINKSMKDRDDEVQLDTQNLRESAPHFPSGSVVIDYLIGGKPNKFGVPPCPGIPRGRIMNLYGNPGAGKTTIVGATTITGATVIGPTLFGTDIYAPIIRTVFTTLAGHTHTATGPTAPTTPPIPGT